jgi:hypothetical protein
MKIKVTKDHDHKVKPAVTMAFKARPEPYDVPKAIAAALIEAGAAQPVSKPAAQEK